MQILRSKFTLVLTVILLFKSFVFSQDPKQRAEENPLSTVFYLLSTTEKDSKEEEKACLATSLASVDRYAEIEDVAKMIEDGSYVDKNFVALTKDLIAKGKTKEASKHISFLIIKAGDDEELLQQFFKPLILLKRDDDAIEILKKFSDYKIDGAFEVIKIYLELGQTAKVLDIISNVENLIENSEYGVYKATLGYYYAKVDKQSEALRFLQSAMKTLVEKPEAPEFTKSEIIDLVVDTYRTLGKYKEADEILVKQGKSIKPETPKTLIETAEVNLANGNHAKADELIKQGLKQLNPKDYGDSFDLGRIIEFYLKLGEIEKAEQIAKSLSGSDYIQQKQLLNIADFHIKKKNNSKAFDILNFALEQTKKFDPTEKEDGRLWTSGKWKQAQYQSQIAIRLIDMQFDKQALDLISQIKKPYLRALTLNKFVTANKKRISSKKLSAYLKEALSLLGQKKKDIFDSRKFDVYAITARNFAEIGMVKESNQVFAETLSRLSKEMIESGTDSGLLFGMCSIGVEFDKSKIKPNKKLKESLGQIINSWENEKY